MIQKSKLIFITIPLIFFICIILFFAQKNNSTDSASKQEIITIGIPVTPYIQELSVNYYKEWLEKETGLTIHFILLPQEYTSEYLDQMFHSGNIPMDALFSFPYGNDVLSANYKLQEYGEKGYILPLNDYINQSTQMNQIFSDFKLYNLKKAMTSPNGNMYYMPGLDSSLETECPQILWINQRWLKELGLPIPRTLDEFTADLRAFHEKDPNENGLQDEIPLAGSNDTTSEESYNFLINSFLYNNPDNCRMNVQNGIVSFGPLTSEWRQSVQYLHDIYSENLLDPFQFTLSHQQLIQLANDPRDLLGAFTSSSITEVLLPNSPEIMSNFVRVPPLEGPSGVRYAMIETPLPRPNGVITSSCKNPAAVFHLFEVMLSQDAFLIGRYGEENVDWSYAKPGDIDIFGNKAVLRVKNQLHHKVQNKTLLELGPFFAYSNYTMGVAWNGVESDQEYINARAYSLYRQYRPSEYVKTLFLEGTEAPSLIQLQDKAETYTASSLQQFIQGELDPYNDAQWQTYLDRYQAMGIDRLIDATQRSYDSLE